MKRTFLALATAAAVAVGGAVAIATPGFAAVTCPPGGISGQTISGSVIVPSGVSCDIVNSQIGGSVTVQPGGATNIESSTIGGNLTSASGADAGGHTVVMQNSVIRGKVHVTDSAGKVDIGIGGGNRISGGVYLSGNAGPVLLRNNHGSCNIGSCYIGGSATVSNNGSGTSATGTTIVSNTIRAALSCTGNNPAPTGSANTAASKSGQCSSL
jgi:hypothetical protein